MSQVAPGRLEVVREFVNTVDLESGEEDLATPDALAAWLGERGLLATDDADVAGPVELRRAHELREALRELLLANHPDAESPAPSAVGVVEACARRARLELRFAPPDGVAGVLPGRGGVDGALGALLAIVAGAQADGTWERLKACPWDTCKWAFYDHSRNRSGVWCSMKVCGNRAKAASFRQRRRADAHAG